MSVMTKEIYYHLVDGVFRAPSTFLDIECKEGRLYVKALRTDVVRNTFVYKRILQINGDYDEEKKYRF